MDAASCSVREDSSAQGRVGNADRPANGRTTIPRRNCIARRELATELSTAEDCAAGLLVLAALARTNAATPAGMCRHRRIDAEAKA